jgi:hypothetical protein
MKYLERRMKMNLKRRLAVAIVLGLLSLFLGFRLLATADFNYRLKRGAQKAQIKFSAFRGQKPRPVSLAGKLIGSGGFTEAVKGAEVVAVESTSGYAATADAQGQFILPHLVWFPGASYTLVVTADIRNVRRTDVTAPASYPTSGIIDVGELVFDDEREIPFLESPTRHIKHDAMNGNYYKELFERLTSTAETHDGRIDIVCKYVATRHNPFENVWSFRSARQILERGAPHCSNLAFAMAAITAAGGYPTRTVHTSDNPQFIRTHVAVEVYYDDAWHLYDPTYGIAFLNRAGSVANYKELMLAPELINQAAFRNIDSAVVQSALEWMPNAYGSGLHQFYYVDEDVFV